tara:strand:- start:441 stop:701 length:261 start_codon:yes stop_codon:yes gene_type:complete
MYTVSPSITLGVPIISLARILVENIKNIIIVRMIYLFIFLINNNKKKAKKTPVLLASRSLISKALLGIIMCNNSNNIETQNKKGKL